MLLNLGERCENVLNIDTKHAKIHIMRANICIKTNIFTQKHVQLHETTIKILTEIIKPNLKPHRISQSSYNSTRFSQNSKPET